MLIVEAVFTMANTDGSGINSSRDEVEDYDGRPSKGKDEGTEPLGSSVESEGVNDEGVEEEI